MFKISQIHGLEVFDSRGNPTVRAYVELDSGEVGMATVPSGASTGKHEAKELRDGGARHRGLGVKKAIQNIEKKISKALKNREIFDQEKIDEILISTDGKKDKSRLGANALLAVSLAAARAAAQVLEVPLYAYLRSAFFPEIKDFRLPTPTFNVLNGGRHADTELRFQEFMIVPKMSSFAASLTAGSEIYHALKKIIHVKGLSTAVGDEGGFAPRLSNPKEALELLMTAIKSAKYKAGKEIFLAMDVASSEFYKSGRYEVEAGRMLTGNEFLPELLGYVESYQIVSIEDPFAEDDWKMWSLAFERLSKKIKLIGDDLFVTNPERIEKGIVKKAANALLVKPNQIGTLTETVEAISLARQAGWAISVSHRSGDTADTFIADLAVAARAEFLKAGAPARSERVEKYNRLLEIESDLKS